MSPLLLGSLAVSLLGPLPYPLVLAIIETTKGFQYMVFGAINCAYIVRIVTIVNQSWINKFEDSLVIRTCVICSVLHYGIYGPDLVMVTD